MSIANITFTWIGITRFKAMQSSNVKQLVIRKFIIYMQSLQKNFFYSDGTKKLKYHQMHLLSSYVTFGTFPLYFRTLYPLSLPFPSPDTENGTDFT